MQFSLIAFPPNLGGKILWAQGENFLPGFPLPLFSPHCQTVENSVFHSVFLPIFSIPPKIYPIKHNVKEAIRARDSSKAGLKNAEKQVEEQRKQLHYTEINLATEKQLVKDLREEL